MRRFNFLTFLLCIAPIFLFSQNKIGPLSENGTVTIEGAIKNEQNGNFLPDALVTVYDDRDACPDWAIHDQ